MNLLKKDSDKYGKKLPPPKPMGVYYFCNACGEKFKVDRADARFCHDICRAAAYSVAKNIITVPHSITPEEAQRYDSIVIKLKDENGKVERALFEKDGDGIFNRIKNETKRTGDKDADEATEKAIKEEAELKEAAEKGKKIEPAPKNDKRLITGEMGKEMDKLEKKEKKKAANKKKGE